MGFPPVSEEHFGLVREFFSRDVCIRGTKPLRDRIEIAIFVDDRGPLTLTKEGGAPKVIQSAPHSADLTFWVPLSALKEIDANKTNDLGELGVAILKLMTHSDPNTRIKAKVHIGLFEFLRGGYLGVLPLGGTTVMKYLASHGLTGIGKIKDAIAKLRH